MDIIAGDYFLGLYYRRFTISVGHILSSYGVMAVLCRQTPYCEQHIAAALHDLEPTGTGTVSRSCSVSCGWQWQLHKPASSTAQC